MSGIGYVIGAEPGKVMFKGDYFDCGSKVGLSVQLTDGTRNAVCMGAKATPAEIATALRGLAAWCDSKSAKLPEDTRS